MKMRINLLLIILVFISLKACGQYFQFSQYNFTPQRVSPTAPGVNDYASAQYLYRHHALSKKDILNSHILSFSYPLISKNDGKRTGGVGLFVLDDRMYPSYKMQEGALTYAKNWNFSNNNTLTLGFTGRYHQQNIASSSVQRFSNALSARLFSEQENGKALDSVYKNFSMSSGLHWQVVDKNGIPVIYLNISGIDLVNSYEFNNSPMAWIASGSVRLLRGESIAFFPEFLYVSGANYNLINIGLNTSFDVNKYSRDNYHVNVITKYLSNDRGLLALQYHTENFGIGVGYETSLQREQKMSNVFEIGLLLKTKVKKKIVRKRLSAPGALVTTAPRVNNQVKTIIEESVDVKTDSYIKEVKDSTLSATLINKANAVSHDKTDVKVVELDKITLNVSFGFASSTLDPSVMKQLDEVIEAMLTDGRFMVKISGHTDNIGSEETNMRLSLHRANTVKKYLVEKGISESRISIEGKGLTEPLNDNKTEAERALNRRVEVRILFRKNN